MCMFKFLIALALLTGPAAARADIPDDTDSVGYDEIVNQLNKENASTIKAQKPKTKDENSFDTVWMHGGIGFANYIESVKFDDGSTALLNQKGVQAALGLDLFSPNWMAEGTARAFAEDGDSKVRSSVKEFELKVLYKDKFAADRFGYRAGLGLTGRYLTIKRQGFADQDYTTPTSVATVGGDMFINERFSVGADLNARNSLIGETIDHNSIDMTLRVDAHF